MSAASNAKISAMRTTLTSDTVIFTPPCDAFKLRLGDSIALLMLQTCSLQIGRTLLIIFFCIPLDSFRFHSALLHLDKAFFTFSHHPYVSYGSERLVEFVSSYYLSPSRAFKNIRKHLRKAFDNFTHFVENGRRRAASDCPR